jgi:hypothetical protein
VHVAIVDVDRETGRVGIENYAVAHDCGGAINPMLVEGQIMGGAGQGLGGVGLGQRIKRRKKSSRTSRSLSIRCNSCALRPSIPLLRSRYPSSNLWAGCVGRKSAATVYTLSGVATGRRVPARRRSVVEDGSASPSIY